MSTRELKLQVLRMLATAAIAKAAKTDEEAAKILQFNPYYIIQNGLTPIANSNKKVGAR